MGIAAKIADGRRRLERLTGEFRNDEEGATAIEYGLIVSLIFVVIIAAVKSVASSNNDNYELITDAMSGE